MKTRYKYIHFEEGPGPKAVYPSYYCWNNRNDHILGKVFFYRTWDKYVFEGGDGCVFSASCLEDIIDFLKQLNE